MKNRRLVALVFKKVLSIEMFKTNINSTKIVQGNKNKKKIFQLNNTDKSNI